MRGGNLDLGSSLFWCREVSLSDSRWLYGGLSPEIESAEGPQR